MYGVLPCHVARAANLECRLPKADGQQGATNKQLRGTIGSAGPSCLDQDMKQNSSDAAFRGQARRRRVEIEWRRAANCYTKRVTRHGVTGLWLSSPESRPPALSRSPASFKLRVSNCCSSGQRHDQDRAHVLRAVAGVRLNAPDESVKARPDLAGCGEEPEAGLQPRREVSRSRREWSSGAVQTNGASRRSRPPLCGRLRRTTVGIHLAEISGLRRPSSSDKRSRVHVKLAPPG